MIEALSTSLLKYCVINNVKLTKPETMNEQVKTMGQSSSTSRTVGKELLFKENEMYQVAVIDEDEYEEMEVEIYDPNTRKLKVEKIQIQKAEDSEAITKIAAY